MILAFDSMTGNTKRFAQKVVKATGIKAVEIRKLAEDSEIEEEFVLITHTFGKGQVPESTRKFLMNNGDKLRAVSSSGSVHWGANFGRAGDILSVEYKVPLLTKFNKSGHAEDVEKITGWLAA